MILFAVIADKESGRKLSRQVEDACILLSEYNFRLNAELEERKMVGKMLKDFIACQREQLISAEKKLEVRLHEQIRLFPRESKLS